MITPKVELHAHIDQDAKVHDHSHCYEPDGAQMVGQVENVIWLLCSIQESVTPRLNGNISTLQ
jgi:hypothetical protein